MNTHALCPLCGEGHVSAQVDQVENEYKGQKALLPQHFQVCDHCGSDFAGAVETKLNRRTLLAWRKQVDGLLTGAEISDLRQKYQITQAQAARLFGGGPVAFSKYENDDVAQSEAMDNLLRVVRRSRTAFAALVDEKGMTDELAGTPSVVPVGLKLLPPKQKSVSITQQITEPSPIYDPKEFRVGRGTSELQGTQR
jgi:HTH-type transcriptional regulator/antitoxin MqsA